MSIMAWLKKLRRRGLDHDDFAEEIRAHLAIAADERMADGADRETARLASLKDFRNLAKNPVFSLTVVGVLALGIGLNAAVFTMLKGIAFSPIAGVSGSAQLAV